MKKFLAFVMAASMALSLAACGGSSASTATRSFVDHSSTFFNSGYIDYLDANYSEPEQIIDPEEGDRSIYQDEEDYRRLREELG